MEELKPCPFCGEEAVFLCVMDSVAIVGCSNKISCWMKPSTSVYKNKEGDFNLFNWNNRPYENKIKADAVREAARACNAEMYSDEEYEFDRNYLGDYCETFDLMEHANKLERGEV